MKRVLIALAALVIAWNLTVIDFLVGADDHLVTIATLVAATVLVLFIGWKATRLFKRTRKV